MTTTNVYIDTSNVYMGASNTSWMTSSMPMLLYHEQGVCHFARQCWGWRRAVVPSHPPLPLQGVCGRHGTSPGKSCA